MYRTNNYNIFIFILLLFFISPILSFFLGLFYIRKSYFKYVFILCSIYFGFIFLVPKSIVSEAFDSEFYATQLKILNYNKLDLFEYLGTFYSVESKIVDVYQPMVTWLIANYTSNYHYLFAFFAIVFSYFSIKSIQLIFNKLDARFDYILFYLLLLYIAINPIWNINGVRMYTAMNIFIYGIFLIFINGQKKGLFYLLLSAFVHVSFVVPFIFYLSFHIFKNGRITVFFILLFILLLFENIINYELPNIVNYLPDFLNSKLSYYVDSDYKDLVNEKANSISTALYLYNFSISLVINSILLVLYLNRKKIFNNAGLDEALFKFILYSYILVTIISVIPSAGRFYMLVHLMTLGLLISKYKELKEIKNIRYYFNFIFIFISYFLIFSLRNSLDFFGISAIFGNPITLIFIEDQQSLINFL